MQLRWLRHARLGERRVDRAEVGAMSGQDADAGFDVSRRRLLAAAGAGSLVAASLGRAAAVQAAPVAGGVAGAAGVPGVAGLHLQFGADASVRGHRVLAHAAAGAGAAGAARAA